MDLWDKLKAADESGMYIFERGGTINRVLGDLTNKGENSVQAEQIEKSGGRNVREEVSEKDMDDVRDVRDENDVFVKARRLMESTSVGKKHIKGQVSKEAVPSEIVEPASLKVRQIGNVSIRRLDKRNKTVKESGQVTVKPVLKKVLKKEKVVTKISNDGYWSYSTQFTVDTQHWAKLHKGMKLDDKYGEYFTNHLMSRLNIACVLKSAGPYIAYGKFNMRFNCSNWPCKRKFLIKQIFDSNFKLFDNGEPEHHDGNERARPIRNIKRTIVSKGLVKMYPEDYLMFCQNGINQSLYERGHLQDLVSKSTASRIRTDGLVNELDYDKDDIIDLLKMKLGDEYKLMTKQGLDKFIRRLNLDAFAVLMYSNAQLELLKKNLLWKMKS